MALWYFNLLIVQQVYLSASDLFLLSSFPLREWEILLIEQTLRCSIASLRPLERLAQYLEITSASDYRFTHEDFRWARSLLKTVDYKTVDYYKRSTTVRQEHSGHIQANIRVNIQVTFRSHSGQIYLF